MLEIHSSLHARFGRSRFAPITIGLVSLGAYEGTGTIFSLAPIVITLIPFLFDPDAQPLCSATKRVDGGGVDASESPRKGNGSITTKGARKVLPQSQRVLRSATRASRATAAAAQVATATKHPSRRGSAVKTTLPAPTARTTRLATLRRVHQSSSNKNKCTAL